MTAFGAAVAVRERGRAPARAPNRSLPKGARVPVEWIGRARALRSRVTDAAARADEITEKLVAPLRPRPGFTPMPRHALLGAFPAAWKAMPSFGRLRLVAGFDAGKLQVVELRAEPMTITDAGWSEDEPALVVILRSLAIKPPEFDEKAVILAVAGLRALARRFQRSRERDNEAVLRDLLPLARGAVDRPAWGAASSQSPSPLAGAGSAALRRVS